MPTVATFRLIFTSNRLIFSSHCKPLAQLYSTTPSLRQTVSRPTGQVSQILRGVGGGGGFHMGGGGVVSPAISVERFSEITFSGGLVC